MRIAAITMAYQEYAMLEKWYHHYGELVGYDNLYVVSHGFDERHRDITPKASHITFPRHQMKGFEGNRQNALSELQKSLYRYYDAVIRVDVDEFLFVDPELHDSFIGCIEKHTKNSTQAWYALGFNSFCLDPETNAETGPNMSAVARHGVVTSVYSKAVAARQNFVVFLHGAWYVGKTVFNTNTCVMPDGLYLAHLKYADMKELSKSNEFRVDMNSEDKGDDNARVGGDAWAKGDEHSALFLRRLRKLPVAPDSEEELALAKEMLTREWRVVAPKSIKGDDARVIVAQYEGRNSFELPERFIGLF